MFHCIVKTYLVNLWQLCSQSNSGKVKFSTKSLQTYETSVYFKIYAWYERTVI